MLVIVDCQYYFLSFWTLKILGIEQKWKPPNSIYVIVGHCWIINMLVHLFIATIYKSLLIKIIAGRSLIRNVHRCTTYPIIFTNTMARKTNYLIFCMLTTQIALVLVNELQNINWCQGITTYCIYNGCPKIISTEWISICHIFW